MRIPVAVRTLLLSGSLIASAAMGALGCDRAPLPPQGQIVLYLDTDAPVPAGAAAPSDDAPAVALFDRILVELYAPGETTPCDDCTRELVVDGDLMRAGRFSFGVVPIPREVGIRARLRLFRSTGQATPRPASTVELVGYLPAVAEDGITELTAVFHVDDVGRPQGTLSAPIHFDRGVPTTSLVGSWSGARVIDCVGQAPEGAVCVPGGAFFMGDPRVNEEDFVRGHREHLVVIAPFFLDATEVTVAAVRASGLAAIDAHGLASDPRDDTQDPLLSQCDYTTEPGANENRPVMCVSWQLARRYCQARGGDLPTEAQFEVVASRRGTTLFPWGDTDPSCDEAVVARNVAKELDGCVTDPLSFDPVLAEPAGSGSLDRVQLPSGVVLDLGANLSEWMLDYFQEDDEPCWATPLLNNPVCSSPGRTPDVRSAKGGSFDVVPVDYAQASRQQPADDEGYVYADVGFRCAYPD